MMSPARLKQSRSLRLYARLLELYPPSFLQRHRAEMLQNFADLEDAEPSKAALWLLIGKDLAMSLISHFFTSQLCRYVIAVFVAWMLLFAIGYFFYGPTPASRLCMPSEAFCPACWPFTSRRVFTERCKTARTWSVSLLRAYCSSRSGISATAARRAIRLCKFSEAFCLACCPCPSRYVSVECRKTARML
jgi:hypothetical protein